MTVFLTIAAFLLILAILLVCGFLVVFLWALMSKPIDRDYYE